MSSDQGGGFQGHRSYVARRFIDDEGDDLEPDHLDLSTSAERIEGDLASLGTASSRPNNFFEKGSKYNVDQSVNLMDTSKGVYESGRNRNKKHARPRLGRKSQMTSMVDVFLDYATDGPGQRNKEMTSRSSKCRELLFSTRFLVFVVLVIVGCLVVVFAVNKDSSPPPKPFVSPSMRGDLQSKIVGRGISSAEAFQDPESPQSKAFKWAHEEDKFDGARNDVVTIQRYILAVLYHATQPSAQLNPVFKSWKTEENWLSKLSVCEWYGVECEKIMGNDAVVHLNLYNNQLQGSIPIELQSLKYLVLLDLSNNKLSGSIPEDIGQMTFLNFLRLQNNHLNGKLPESIVDMKAAEEIFLSNNNIEGTIPDGIGTMSNLRGLKFDHNMLSGSIPKIWKQQHISTLYLQDNEFRGRIPHSLFQLTTLKDFRLGHNFLTGTIPPEIESIYGLEVFEVENNKLNGEVPEVFDRLHHLREINLHHNFFEGDLPVTMGRSQSLEIVLMDENFLVGTIPFAWSTMTTLKTLDLKGNRLTGTIPTMLGSLTNLVDLHLESNKFHGSISESLGRLINLETLSVQNNTIYGSMPQAVCNLKNHKLSTLEANCANGMTCDCCTKCFY